MTVKPTPVPVEDMSDAESRQVELLTSIGIWISVIVTIIAGLIIEFGEGTIYV
jgi:hypothetical protein